MRQLLLHNHNFARLWLGQMISGTATILFDVGVMVAIYQATGSALQTAAVTVAATLPNFLLGPVAGAIVDRYPRRTVLILTDVGRALLVGSLLFIITPDVLPVWVLYFVVVGLSVAMTLYLPARSAIIPSLVTPGQLVTANSLIFSASPLYHALGYLVGGVLVLLISFRAFIWVSVSLFVVAAVLVAFVSAEKRAKTAGANDLSISLWQTIKDGAAYLRQHQLARALVTMEGLEHIGHGIWMPALLLIFVEQALGGNARDWGWQMGLYYAGQIFGVVLIMMATNTLARRPGWIIIINAFTTGLLTLVYAASPTLLFAHVLCFVFGVPYAWRDVAQDSLLQTSVDPAVLGRIYAFRGMFLNLMLMLSTLLFAWLADQIPIRWIYVVGGAVYLGTAVYALSRSAMRHSRIETEETGRVETGDWEIPQTAITNPQLERKA
jgi:MFS family permease